MVEGLLGNVGSALGGVGDFLLNRGQYADPTAINQQYGVPQADVRQAGINTLANVSALLLAAGQPMTGAQRAQMLAQIGPAMGGMQTDIFKASQARLMNAQMREKMTEMQEIQAINERRKNDPAGLARSFGQGFTEDLVKSLDARTLREMAKQITIKRASVTPAQQAASARIAQYMGIGTPSAAPAVGAGGGVAPAAAPAAPMDAEQAQAAMDQASWQGQAAAPTAAPAAGAPAAAPPAAALPIGQMTPTQLRQMAADPIIVAGNPEYAKKLSEIAEKLETPGAKEAQILTARREAERMSNMPKMEMSVANRTAQTKDALDLTNNLIGRVGLATTGVGGWASRNIPGTPAFDFLQDVKALQSRLGLDELRTLKDAGGTLGQVSNFELQTLQASIASLETAQSPAQIKENLEKIKNVMRRSTNLYLNAFEKDYKRKPDIEGYLRQREELAQGNIPGQVPAAAPATPAATGGQQLRSDPAVLAQAKSAIARGANPEQIRQRLRQNGISDEGL